MPPKADGVGATTFRERSSKVATQTLDPSLASQRQIGKQVFDAVKSVTASRPSIAKLGALSSVGFSGKTVGSDHAARDRCPGLADHQAVLDAIEQVTIGAKEIEIQLCDAVVVDGQDRTLTVPWIPTSPYQRRQIVRGEDEPRAPIRPMRVRARAVFTESLRNARHWLDELITVDWGNGILRLETGRRFRPLNARK